MGRAGRRAYAPTGAEVAPKAASHACRGKSDPLRHGLNAFRPATTRLRQGLLDAACESAGPALDFAVSLDSPRVAGHVWEFRQHLTPYSREAPVNAFEQRTREVLG